MARERQPERTSAAVADHYIFLLEPKETVWAPSSGGRERQKQEAGGLGERERQRGWARGAGLEKEGKHSGGLPDRWLRIGDVIVAASQTFGKFCCPCKRSAWGSIWGRGGLFRGP